MKIRMSPKGHEKGKHLIFTVKREDSYDAHNVIATDVLEGAARPVREEGEDGEIVYRFALKWLDNLMLAFPMAELSPVIRRRISKVEEKRLADMEVPKLKVPGYSGWKIDYQMIGAKAILDGDIDLLNDEMGLGKTYQFLMALAILVKRAKKEGRVYSALLVCPNGVKHTWAEAIEDYFENLTAFVVEGDPAQRASIIRKARETHGGVCIVNWEGLNAKPIHENPDNKRSKVVGYEYRNESLFEDTWDFFCTDEHHRVKTPDAQVTRGFFQIAAERELHMSGTPILNRVEEIWTVLHRLYPEEFPSYEPFVRSLGITNSFNKIVAYKPAAMKALREFLQNVSLRRRKDQVLDNLPDVVYIKRRIELTKEQRKLYEQIRDEMILQLEDGTIKDILGALPQITRLKQACFSPELYGGSDLSAKIIELKSIVRELVDSGEKAIVFTQWSTSARIIERELAKYNPAYVTGEIPVKGGKRQAQIRKFRDDDTCKLYIGTIGANREGINLGNATYVIFTDLDWVPVGHDQAVGRSAAGGLRGVDIPEGTKVHVIEIQAEDTFEDKIEFMHKKKRGTFDRLVERDAGRPIEHITLADIRSIL